MSANFFVWQWLFIAPHVCGTIAPVPVLYRALQITRTKLCFHLVAVSYRAWKRMIMWMPTALMQLLMEHLRPYIAGGLSGRLYCRPVPSYARAASVVICTRAVASQTNVETSSCRPDKGSYILASCKQALAATLALPVSHCNAML